MPHPRQSPITELLGDRQVSRRAFTMGALSAVALGALAACGSDTPAGGSSGGTGSSGSGGFPVTITHKLGTTTIDAQPTKVASIGYTEQDFLLALGIVPVAVTDWYGDQPDATWPWAHDLLGDAKPKVLSDADGIQFLEIDNLKPDLILGLNAGVEQSDYQKLARIAPTIGTPADSASDYFDSWRVYLKTIGAAVGKSAEAAELETSVNDQFKKAAADHPEFAGKKAIFLQNAVYDGNFIAYQAGLSTEFLTDLGFVIPPELDDYVPAEGGQAMIPAEKIEVLNVADYLIWGTEKDQDKTELEKVPGFSKLAAVKSGKSVYTGGVLAGAIYFASPVSLPYVVEKLVPLLSAEG